MFGPEMGLQWFREKQGYITWKKRPEEAYWRTFVSGQKPHLLRISSKHKG